MLILKSMRMRSLMFLATVFLATVTSLACGGSSANGTSSQRLISGDPAADPSMEVLPTRNDSVTEKMRFAWLLTAESFELRRPRRPPRGAAMQELQMWSEQELRNWLAQKNEMVEAARAELNVAAEESHRQRVWAGALVGLMYEDVGRVLLDVPVPRELDSDPEIAQVYREVVVAQARPYLDHARRAYRACELNGRRQNDSLTQWSRFCEERKARLPVLDLAPGESRTTVEVVRE